MLKIIQIPTKCSECKASCPMTIKGCPYELWLEARDLAARLEAKGIQFTGLEALKEAAKGPSKECRAALAKEIEAENQLTKMTAKILAHGGPVLQALQAMAEQAPTEQPMVDSPTVVPVPVDVQDVVVPQGNGMVMVAKTENHAGRGRKDLYVVPSDEAYEAKLQHEPGVYAISMVPKIKVANWQAKVEELKPQFENSPFEGFVHAVAKRHEAAPDLCRIAVWYRGPPPTEAGKILSQRKGAAPN